MYWSVDDSFQLTKFYLRLSSFPSNSTSTLLSVGEFCKSDYRCQLSLISIGGSKDDKVMKKILLIGRFQVAQENYLTRDGKNMNRSAILVPIGNTKFETTEKVAK